jgi:serine/threonine-protein kinase HipA
VNFNYLVGHNDAHGKNFSLLYRNIGTGEQEIRLAPLYDLVSTLYYPDLSRTMAMKIGDEYSSEQVTPKDFERLADQALLAKPIVKRRVPELADTLLTVLAKVDTDHPVARAVAALIRERCETAREGFRDH